MENALVAGIAVDEIVAWLLLFSGALHIAFAWRGHGPTGELWEILLGLAYGSIGVYLLMRPLLGLTSLTLAVAVYSVVEATLAPQPQTVHDEATPGAHIGASIVSGVSRKLSADRTRQDHEG